MSIIFESHCGISGFGREVFAWLGTGAGRPGGCVGGADCCDGGSSFDFKLFILLITDVAVVNADIRFEGVIEKLNDAELPLGAWLDGGGGVGCCCWYDVWVWSMGAGGAGLEFGFGAWGACRAIFGLAGLLFFK